MTINSSSPELATQLQGLLPYLRRHARAMTGNQTAGDDYALATLETVMDDVSALDMTSSLKVGLFRAFVAAWQDDDSAPIDEEGLAVQAQTYLRALTPHSRQALLLHSIEGFSHAEISEVMQMQVDEVKALIDTARSEMKESITGSILVIEDEVMIAMDLQDIVVAMDHNVTGVAATRDQAVDMASVHKPDLILSDILLADGSSGIDAVDEILEAAGRTPVIFITAFPERLLTGERKEPAFLITKPYGEEQVQSAVSQAMFFRSAAAISL